MILSSMNFKSFFCKKCREVVERNLIEILTGELVYVLSNSAKKFFDFVF